MTVSRIGLPESRQKCHRCGKEGWGRDVDIPAINQQGFIEPLTVHICTDCIRTAKFLFISDDGVLRLTWQKKNAKSVLSEMLKL